MMKPYVINIDDKRRNHMSHASDTLGMARAEIFRRMVDHWVSGGAVRGLPAFPRKGRR